MTMYARFTFHYGSILIYISTFHVCFSKIYIPLWFYSNASFKDFEKRQKKFTFHYGSILIIFRMEPKKSVVYLHSTMVLF